MRTGSKETPAILGKQAEAFAAAYLQARGLRLITMNYRCRGGEIDLIMREGRILVFVEVRYRKGSSFASAAESIDERKQRHLAKAASHYLQRQPAESPCRFDVVAITGMGERLTVEWLRNAIELH